MLEMFDTKALGFFVPAPTWGIEDIPDLTGKVAIVTGANTGIGKQSAKHLLQSGATVYAAARSEEKCLNAIEDIKAETKRSDIHFLHLDLGDIAQSYSAGLEFAKSHDRLDMLINSAGVMTPPKGSRTKDGYDLQFGTNCIGHFAFSQPLLKLLRSTAKTAPANSVRIVWVSSAAHFLGSKEGIDFESITEVSRVSPFYHYSQRHVCEMLHTLSERSKLGSIHLANECANRLRDDGIISVSLRNISTDLQRNMWLVRTFMPLYSASLGCLTQLYAATSTDVTMADTGSYYVPWARKYHPSHPKANDPDSQRSTWEFCQAQLEKVVGPTVGLS
ncbi:hypothetical protein BD324DRAFT_679349 [Kockovaella imperatae]|uniref:Short-chain dehydrogenase n=1 Tax=Kockovaella imperatae TaxID=4999 RepID=A0A1Y1UQK9_9TREE|nr:hypothetical protein BD324DRAFT_679349 [Kockovaella imperatae]ORX40331.1 hypothetical protein BD324DRAFT_679349 [Kockovaella imperatae]